jgi:DNA-binding protein HU-beta
MAKVITKSDLVDQMAKKLKMSKVKTADAVNLMIQTISKEVSKGNKVQLIGFGSFSSAKRAKRNGRNPQTGKKMSIPAKKVPKFSAGKALKDAVAKKK